MTKTLLVGIDVDSKHNECCFLDQEGNSTEKIFSVSNNLPGAQELEDKVVATMKKHGFEQLKIAAEATSFLDLPLVDYLATSETLRTYNPTIYQLNPRIVRGLKKAYADMDKVDPVDAFAVAERLRFGRLPEPYEEHQPYLPLRRLTRFRFHIVKDITREKNYFLIHLFLKFSSYKSVKPFSDTFGATSQAVITEFLSLDEIASMSMDDLVSFLMKHGKNKFSDPTEVADKLKKVARESYRLRPALASSVNLILAMSLKNIRALEKVRREVDKVIEKEFAAFPNTLQSVKGIGPVYSAGIYAEIGDIGRFRTQSKLAKFAGLTWRKRSSGEFEAEFTPMTKTGNEFLRYYFIEAANMLRIHNEEYKAYYRTKYAEVTRHRHKRALALTARKLVRLVFALLKNNQLYQRSQEL